MGNRSRFFILAQDMPGFFSAKRLMRLCSLSVVSLFAFIFYILLHFRMVVKGFVNYFVNLSQNTAKRY